MGVRIHQELSNGVQELFADHENLLTGNQEGTFE
jgi:hypothetical protein